MTDVKLEPCPFCRGQAEWASRKPYLVHCANPDCLGHHYEQDEQGGYNHSFYTEAEAIAAWNTRTAAQPEREADGERCHDCGSAYEIVYRVPDDVWTQIAPDKAGLGDSGHQYGGLLCPACANRRARELGIYLYFDASVGDWRQEREAVLEEAELNRLAGRLCEIMHCEAGQITRMWAKQAVLEIAALTTPASAVSTDEIVAALTKAREALHFHYVEWDGEPEDAVPLQLARSECDAILSRIRGEGE